MSITYVKHEKISVKNHNGINEKWIQDRIADNPSILGLGDLILKDKERIQPSAGRLDLLFQDSESNIRYEVEVQLGKTDESHIIRTIEYWDLERKRYPQYDHVAVLIAEDITSRFLNIINLFNGTIPLVAIQLNAIQNQNQVMLVFTTVLDQRIGFAYEEEEFQETTDRSYWERRASKATVSLADDLLELCKFIDKDLSLKYNKFYIGLAKGLKPYNFILFRPKREAVRVELKILKSQQIEDKLEESGLDLLEYDNRNRRYRIRLKKHDLTDHQDLIKELISISYKEFSGDSQDY